MKNLTAALCVSLVIFAASAETPRRDAAAFRLEPVKQLRKGVDAWPLIVAPSNPTEQIVNATLTMLNQRLAQALSGCDDAYRESLGMTGDDSKAKDAALAAWARRVEVTMTGPRFLSLVASDDVFCGGNRPNNEQFALVFDMNTGTQVDWMVLVAKTAGAPTYMDTVSDGSTAKALILPALRKMSVATAVPDCKDAFQDSQSYLIWPDARHGRLVAQPFDLPHVVGACAEEIHLTMGQARKLGFDETLLKAIDQAHHRVVSKPNH